MEEVRLLDYGQRLITHRRNTFAPNGGDGAAYALQQLVINGRNAAGKLAGNNYFEVVQQFDALIIDDRHPLISGAPPYWLSTIFYHFNASDFYGTIISGK